jgi:hypothetical protein
MAKAVDISASSAFLARMGGWDQRFESTSLQRRVLCEPEAGAVMVGNFFQQLRNEGLEILPASSTSLVFLSLESQHTRPYRYS